MIDLQHPNYYEIQCCLRPGELAGHDATLYVAGWAEINAAAQE
jgi:hypothetical protein